MIDIHKKFIRAALAEAKKAEHEVPVGALIVKDGEILASAHNMKEQNIDVSAHAEILAIRTASEKLNRWRLDDVSMYVTLEPCPMCAAAILYSRIPNLYFGAYDKLYGAFGTAINLSELIKADIKIFGGIEEQMCADFLKDFFKVKR